MAEIDFEKQREELAKRLKDAADNVYALTSHNGFQLLMEQIELEADEAKEELSDVDFEDLTAEGRKRVRDLQARVRAFKWLKDTVARIVVAGDQEEAIDEIGRDTEGEGDMKEA